MQLTKILLLTFSLMATVGYGQQATNADPSLEITIPFLPKPVIINGKHTLIYEVRLVNRSLYQISIIKLEVVNNNSTVIGSFLGNELVQRFSTEQITPEAKQQLLIGPGKNALVYMELIIESEIETISHAVHYKIENESSELTLTRGGVIKYKKDSPMVLGPPLSGGPWAAVHDPAWERGHRRVVYTVDGTARIPGRFAIDFILLNKDGHLSDGENDLIKNWYGYGANVLAVADGVVASTRDDFEESATLSGHPKYAADQATGNYISLKIAEHQYVFYEHLKPQSIRVKPGQLVKQGDVIASLGFTGQTTGPHLHFHVADNDSPLGAEGIPFVFRNFTSVGAYTDFSIFGEGLWQLKLNKGIKNERPAPNSVLIFK